MGSWKKVPEWTYNFISNAAIKDYLQSVFPKLDVAKIFEQNSILAYDLFRYTIVYQNGGMYADSDVNKADQFQDSMTNLRDCNVIVGIEGDLRTEPEWVNRLPRSLQICQWSFYAKERHPMVKYAMDRIVDKIWWLQQKKKNLHDQDVMEVTGPGIWTDAVIDYIKVNAGVDIKEYMKCGQSYRFKDICILNVKAFASTMPHSTCKSETNENSYIINTHHFLGSWRNN
ncbi:glycosyltransferase family 32 protein [Conidiobolus coronatus NRRL 28638]|uniref:Glycosyltransferase family 32 protein n=1 Tax=Conidiobolus coronatus (strain ATCC 28846 / CBS 209.66 / NRRL 28638) TaxID=796925 RepID=A0A137NTR5_CONC2|nr:glycosyltransferase family 32 protein [Conidiobolus coronatus NRRL 28638]|eukprot:KXN66195.1 glycosyltransferase family 32 protein [Conidiobolus coronatus NRRL 28638]